MQVTSDLVSMSISISELSMTPPPVFSAWTSPLSSRDPVTVLPTDAPDRAALASSSVSPRTMPSFGSLRTSAVPSSTTEQLVLRPHKSSFLERGRFGGICYRVWLGSFTTENPHCCITTLLISPLCISAPQRHPSRPDLTSLKVGWTKNNLSVLLSPSNFFQSFFNAIWALKLLLIYKP